MAHLGCLVTFLFLIKEAFQASTPTDDFYTAAVLDHYMSDDVEENLAKYVSDIKTAAELGADIIVTPEFTLTTDVKSVPVPIHGLLRHHPIPALHPELYDEILVQVSAAARKYHIYVVLNVAEMLDCINNDSGETCCEKQIYNFNTNVVFDRNGKVIDRYRKIHLFNEDENTPAIVPEIGKFETDFGVTFGHFICFDLLFQMPAMILVEKYNITNIAMPVMWYSELPYLTAVQVQQDYSFAMNINLLSSGGIHDEIGGGIPHSGVHSGRAGKLKSIQSVPSHISVVKVPKIPGKITKDYADINRGNPVSFESLPLLTDSSLPFHETRLLKAGNQGFTLVSNDVICYFNITMRYGAEDLHYKYRAGAYSGVRSVFGYANQGIRCCSIFACTDDSIYSCGQRFATYTANSTAFFEELTIEGIVPTPVTDRKVQASDSTFAPTSLTLSIMPLQLQDFIYDVYEKDDLAIHGLKLINNDVELISFGLRGRIFNRDNEMTTDVLMNDH